MAGRALMDAGAELRRGFAARYATAPHLARAPGRVNLIGDHTDYNGGLVMPAALDVYSWVAAAPRRDRRMVVHSDLFDETVECRLADIQSHAALGRAAHWADYPLGVAACLLEAGCPLEGATLMIAGNVPFGAGLSSSASLEVATAGALLATSRHRLEPKEIALLCQRAENVYVGMRCGIMDQYIAVFGRADCALQIDCRRLEHRLIPVSFDRAAPGARARLVICDSLRKHELASSEYNRRRAECESALAALQASLPAATTLSDVTPDGLRNQAALLDGVQLQRTRHVLSENERVRLAADALSAGDAPRFGELMYASHRSLRDDYEVSCAELDCLVAAAQRSPGTYGARMTGGGFGGCTVNLVREDCLDAFERDVTRDYRAAFGIEPRLYRSGIGDGLRLLEEASRV